MKRHMQWISFQSAIV